MPTSQGMLSSEATQHKNSILISICLALAIITVITFWQLKDCDFVNFDDNAYVYENGHVQQGLDWKSIQWAFSADSLRATAHWHPIIWLSLMLDAQLFGTEARGYHMINLLLHILNTILLFLIFQRMTKTIWQSAFIAVLFAIHPLHVESVAWVAERKDVLSTFFWMLTMGSYVLYIEQKTLNRYILMTVLFILGLMSKSMLVTLPFALILLDWWPLGRLCPDLSMKAQWGRIRQMVWEKIPLFILSGVFALIAWLSAEHIGTVPLFPLYERLANVFRSYAIYLVKLIWPSDLAVFYPYPEGIILWQIVGAALVLAVITGLVLWMRKRYPFLIVGWLWYLGTLLPVIGIIQAGGQAYADRYTYIPLIGLFIMVAWGIPSLLKQWRYRKEAFFTLSALSILCLFFITWTQVGYWQNDITLFEHAIKANGSNFVAYNNAGIAYGHLGNYRQAIRDFDRAIKINPDYAETYYNRGITYGSLNNYGQAVRDFDRAIKIYPGYVKAFYNRGIIYGSLGNYGQAVRDFDRAIKINPYYAEAYYNRGVTYDKLGNYRQAIEDLKTAARFGHNNAQNFLISRGIKW